PLQPKHPAHPADLGGLAFRRLRECANSRLGRSDLHRDRKRCYKSLGWTQRDRAPLESGDARRVVGESYMVAEPTYSPEALSDIHTVRLQRTNLPCDCFYIDSFTGSGPPHQHIGLEVLYCLEG